MPEQIVINSVTKISETQFSANITRTSDEANDYNGLVNEQISCTNRLIKINALLDKADALGIKGTLPRLPSFTQPAPVQ